MSEQVDLHFMRIHSKSMKIKRKEGNRSLHFLASISVYAPIWKKFSLQFTQRFTHLNLQQNLI